MKKLIYVVSALAALTLIAPDEGFAADNQIGLYSDASASNGSHNFSPMVSTPFSAYLVLTHPVNAASEAVPDVEAFECMIQFTDGTSIFKLAETLAPGSINVGDSTDPAAGLDYSVGIPVPVPVVGNAVVLVEFSFMLLNGNENLVYVVPSRKGFIQYQQGEGGTTTIEAYPSSGSIVFPVASFFGEGVTPVDEETWGGVKALYR